MVFRFSRADKGYDSDEIVGRITALGAAAGIPPRSNRKHLRDCDVALYVERHRIECFFSKLKPYRGLATRCCNRARTFQSLLCLAAAVIWMR
jgi:putative transposase